METIKLVQVFIFEALSLQAVKPAIIPNNSKLLDIQTNALYCTTSKFWDSYFQTDVEIQTGLRETMLVLHIAPSTNKSRPTRQYTIKAKLQDKQD